MFKLYHENSTNLCILGQSAVDAAQDSIQSKNPDDCILACCMQVCERGNRAVSYVHFNI